MVRRFSRQRCSFSCGPAQWANFPPRYTCGASRIKPLSLEAGKGGLCQESGINPMSTQTATPQTEAKPAEAAQPAQQGTQSPGASGVREALEKVRIQDEKTIADLSARIVVLEANQKEATEKKPATDDQIDKAIKALQGKNRADVSKLNLSLSKELGFNPELTKAQKAAWKPAKAEMEKAYSAYWKGHSAEVIGHLRRAVRNPKAVMGGRIATRKTDNAVTSVSLRAKGLAKPLKVKGKGKGAAKPTVS